MHDQAKSRITVEELFSLLNSTVSYAKITLPKNANIKLAGSN